MSKEKKDWDRLYDKHYKHLLIIPAILIIGALVYLAQFSATHDDIVRKDVSLTGGTTITVFEESLTPQQAHEALDAQFPDLLVRSVADVRTGSQQALIIESAAEVDALQPAIEEVVGYALTQDNSSIEFSGASLSEGFYQQLRFAILLAFLFMAIVVFFIFRTFAPSAAVILAAFADILLTVATINAFGMVVSSAGIVALLMLIGYSVDTDVLLTTRVIRQREGTINERMFGALKTGLTMTLTSIVAVGVALAIISSFSVTLSQIFTILLIGLGYDLIFTWFANASIIKWYAEKKKL